MNWRSISSVAMKSAITPSRSGRMISTRSGGLRVCMALALSPTASTSRLPPRDTTATMDGSSMMMPRPTTCTSVLAVPRSMAMSSENAPASMMSTLLPGMRTDMGPGFPLQFWRPRPLRIHHLSGTIADPRTAANGSRPLPVTTDPCATCAHLSAVNRTSSAPPAS